MHGPDGSDKTQQLCMEYVPAQCKSQLDRLSSISIAVQLSSGIPVLHTFEYRVRSIEYRDKYIYKRVVLYTTPYPCPYIQPYLYNRNLKIQPVLLTALYRTVLAHPIGGSPPTVLVFKSGPTRTQFPSTHNPRTSRCQTSGPVFGFPPSPPSDLVG